MTETSATEHASAVLVGPRAVLIRGPSASGKSRLALELIEAARAGVLPFAKLVADDRIHLEAAAGRLLARPAEAIAGLIEVRGIGLMQLDYEPMAIIGFVVDLGARDADRLPETSQRQTVINGISLPRLAVASGVAALPNILTLITSPKRSWL